MTAHQRLVSSTGSSSSNTQHRAGNKRTGDVAGGAAETMSAHLLADWNTSLSLSFSSFGSSGEAAFVAKYAPTPTTLLSSNSSTSELVHQPSPPPPPPSSDTDTTSNNSSSSYSPHEEENNNTTINTNSNNTNNNNTSYDTARFLRRGLSVASSFINNGSINTSGGQQNSHGSTSNNTSGIQKHTTKRTGNEGGAEEERSSIEIQLTTLPPDDVVADSNNNNKSPRELRQEQQLQRQWQHRQQQQQKRQQNNVEQERLKRLYEQQKHQHHYSPRQIQPQPQQPQHQKSSSSVPPSPPHHHRLTRRNSHRLPRVTPAARPFEKMVAPTSYLHDELSKDAAYNHAMKCGVVWQSLVGQFVNFPALWYDGEEPARPYLGCPSKANKWSFFGRHRLALPALRGDQPPPPHNKNLLRTLVSKESSSGKLVLHIIVIDSNTNEPKEDVVVGVFHPNAKGIRPVGPSDSTASQPTQRNAAMTNLDQCRDLWLGHRSRIVAVNGKRHASRIESLLHYRNKQSVDKSPLGPKNTQGIPYHVDNTNMNGIFGRNPPFSTIFVPEQKLYKLLEERPQQQQPQQHRDRSYGSYRRPPASLTLLKAFIGSYTSSNE